MVNVMVTGKELKRRKIFTRTPCQSEWLENCVSRTWYGIPV